MWLMQDLCDPSHVECSMLLDHRELSQRSNLRCSATLGKYCNKNVVACRNVVRLDA